MLSRRCTAGTSWRSEVARTLRLFFALWPPREAAEALHAWALGARRASGGRATQSETIHLTLAFLGEVEEGRLEELKSLAIAGRRHELPIEQARYWAHNRIVWVGPQELPSDLGDLVTDLRRVLEEKRFPAEKREFAAHVTLLRKAHAADALPPLPRVRWPAEEVVLVESLPAEGGRRYELRQRYVLA